MNHGVPEPASTTTAYAPIDESIHTLMIEAAAATAVRLGMDEPFEVLDELGLLSQPFHGPVSLGDEVPCRPPNADWTAADHGADQIDQRAQRDAALMVGTMWAAIRFASTGRSADPAHHVLTALLDPDWLDRLPLPEPPRLPNASGTGPAPCCSEFTVAVREDWALLVCRWLGALSGSKQGVSCHLHDSRMEHEHELRGDGWLSVSIQLSGRVAWRLKSDLSDTHRGIEVATGPGGVSLVPEGLPRLPGHVQEGVSRRLVLVLRR